MGKYSIVGRSMDGKNVTGYYLQENTKNGQTTKMFSKEQVCYLIGKGDVENCTAQIYKDQVLLRGVGINIGQLPVINNKDGSIKNTDRVGKVYKGNTAEETVSQLMIRRRICEGGKTVGFTLMNAGGVEQPVSRANVINLAEAKKIGNAVVNYNNGKKYLRGIGIKLTELPMVDYYDIYPDKRTAKPSAQAEQVSTVQRSGDSGNVNNERNAMVNGRILKNGELYGYTVVDSNGTSSVINKRKLIRLAEANRIRNIAVINSNGTKRVRGVGIKLTGLPVIDYYSVYPNERTEQNTEKQKINSGALINGAVFKDGELYGYNVVDVYGVASQIREKKALRLAKEGRISNAEVKNVNGNQVLVGVGINLETLPAVNC